MKLGHTAVKEFSDIYRVEGLFAYGGLGLFFSLYIVVCGKPTV
jgi:hypothetical protein